MSMMKEEVQAKYPHRAVFLVLQYSVGIQCGIQALHALQHLNNQRSAAGPIFQRWATVDEAAHLFRVNSQSELWDTAQQFKNLADEFGVSIPWGGFSEPELNLTPTAWVGIIPSVAMPPIHNDDKDARRLAKFTEAFSAIKLHRAV